MNFYMEWGVNMEKIDKGLILTAANPLHYGHLELVRIGLSFTKKITIAIGSKDRPYSMPRDVRIASVVETIKESGMIDGVEILAPEKVFGINTSHFSVLITGSDLLNKMLSTNQRGAIIHTKFFLSFLNIICVERSKDKLKDELREKILDQGINLVEKPEISLISSQLIRDNIRTGEEYGHMVHPATLRYMTQYLIKLASPS